MKNDTITINFKDGNEYKYFDCSKLFYNTKEQYLSVEQDISNKIQYRIFPLENIRDFCSQIPIQFSNEADKKE